MNRILTAFCLILITCTHAWGTSSEVSFDTLLTRLDEVISHRAEYAAAKESKLAELRHSLATATSDSARFENLGQLIDEYTPYNTDSALVMCMRRQELALRMREPDKIANASMNTAKILAATGMYKEAIEIMDTVDPADVPDYLRPFYFHILRTVYGHLSDFSVDMGMRRHYAELTDHFRDSLLKVNDPGTLTYSLIKADKLNSTGNYAEALATMQSYMDGHELTEHERAICAWTLSESYANLGDTLRQKEQLALSAISDMKSAVREYVSLRQLALILHSEGDLSRAYKYMNICVDDATKSNARLRIFELINNYPLINGIYIDTIKGQRRSLLWLLGAITVLAVVLLALLKRMRKQMRQIADSRRLIGESNDRLNALNIELINSNNELHEANRAIAENSRLKNAYLGRYMDQCLGYIDKLDTFRRGLAKLEAAGKHDELRRAIKTSTATDSEYKAFYENFDQTFLGLFPSFVEDFNALLQPGEAILPKKDGALTPEQRVFALIRLGISDSDKIAKFLRYSITTIYNYRTKVRNKAAGDRNKLENELMKIGRGTSAR